MIQLTNLGFGIPTFSFSLPIVYKVLYKNFTPAYNSLECIFETLVGCFKTFKQLKHCFCSDALPNFQTTYQHHVSTHMLSSKSHTKRWKVQKSQPFQPQWTLISKRAFHKLRLLPHLCLTKNFWPLIRALKWGTM